MPRDNLGNCVSVWLALQGHNIWNDFIGPCECPEKSAQMLTRKYVLVLTKLEATVGNPDETI